MNSAEKSMLATIQADDTSAILDGFVHPLLQMCHMMCADARAVDKGVFMINCISEVKVIPCSPNDDHQCNGP
jgi:hypothetical protein